MCTFERKGVRTALRGFSIFVYPGHVELPAPAPIAGTETVEAAAEPSAS